MIFRMLDPRDLACAIKKLRGTRKQSALAKSIGVSSSTWCKWEQGGTTPHRVSMPRIAKALGVNVDRLREVAWECSKERMPPDAVDLAPTSGESPHPMPLVQATDVMLRDIDRQIDTLLASKNTLLRIREQLILSAEDS